MVVIHAGAGGIGSTAIQLARAYGNTVIATTGSANKVSFCQRLGADHVLNYREDDLEERLLAIAPDGVDVVLDPIGNTAYADLHTKVLKRYGRWLLMGVLGGGQPATLHMGKLLGQNLLLKGSTLRYQSQDFKIYLTQQLEDEVLLLYQQGEMVPCVDRTFPVSEAEQAHEYLRSNQVQGKVILTF
jgi:NADPH:quinone reductase-like Zn-dependent oxidoreductase